MPHPTVILTDIEGTTSSISFVKNVLFPYARKALPAFVAAHGQEPQVRRCRAGSTRTASTPRSRRCRA